MIVAATPSETPAERSAPDPKPGFWARRLVLPIKTQLTQGVSPAALSWALAAGFLTGIFPILGSTTVLCLLTGVVFRLNQPVIQTIKVLAYPLQLILIPFFIRAGERLVGAEPISFSIPKMLELFGESPGQFFGEFGMTCLHAIAAWCVAAPVVAMIIFLTMRPILQGAARRWNAISNPPAK